MLRRRPPSRSGFRLLGFRLSHRADDVAAARAECESDAPAADVNLPVFGRGRASEWALGAVGDDVLRVYVARDGRALRDHAFDGLGQEYAPARLFGQSFKSRLAAHHLALGLLAPALERGVEGDAGVDAHGVDAGAAHAGRARGVYADGRLVGARLRGAGLLGRVLPPRLLYGLARDGRVADDVQRRLRGDETPDRVLPVLRTRRVYAVGDEHE